MPRKRKPIRFLPPLKPKVYKEIVWMGGYAYLWKDGRRVKRANIVLEEKIGRPLLSNEVAHHKNRNRSDDSPENLELMDRGEHIRLHWKEGTGVSE